jgi:hypothetical protein
MENLTKLWGRGGVGSDSIHATLLNALQRIGPGTVNWPLIRSGFQFPDVVPAVSLVNDSQRWYGFFSFSPGIMPLDSNTYLIQMQIWSL